MRVFTSKLMLVSKCLKLLVACTIPLLFGCTGGSFSGSTKKEEASQVPKVLLDGATSKNSCDLENLDWDCNSDNTSCRTKLPVPDENSWKCKWTTKKFSCETADLDRRPTTCNDAQWKCGESSSGLWNCRIATVPFPDHDEESRSSDWSCKPNSKTNKLVCDAKTEEEESEEEEQEQEPETKKSAEPSKDDNTASDKKPTCKDFNLAGDWAGPWTATTAMGGSGTYSLTFSQAADGKLSGPFKITGTPCAGANSGTITGSYNSDCSIEFMTDVGGGSIGNDSRGFCNFSWKGKVDPVTKTAEGDWTTPSNIKGTWKAEKK